MRLGYLQILAIPGTLAFEAASLATRTAHLMTVLSTVFFISAATGSFGRAGLMSAIYALTYSLASPFVSRVADRGSSGRVLAVAAASNALSRAGFLFAAHAHGPAWVMAALAACSGGSMPAAGPLARARWHRLLRDSPLLHAALSLESVIDELILVVAPIMVAFLASDVSPAAGLILALGLATVGNTALMVKERGARTTRPETFARGLALSAPGFPALLAAFVLVGAAQTIVDLAVIAFSAQHRAGALSGLVLAVIALTSAFSGLLYGTFRRRAPPQQRLLVALGVLTCAMLPLVAVLAMWYLFLAAGLLGLTVAPVFIAGFSTAGQAVPAGQLTEGLTWVTAAMGVGISVGSAIAGQLVDAWGARTAFGAAACCVAVAALAGYVVHRRLRQAPEAGLGRSAA